MGGSRTAAWSGICGCSMGATSAPVLKGSLGFRMDVCVDSSTKECFISWKRFEAVYCSMYSWLYCIFSEPFLLGLQYPYFYEKSFHHRQVDRKLNPVVDFLLRCQPTHKEACKEYKNHLTDCYVLENIFEKFFSIHFLVCIGINESPTTKLTILSYNF